VSEGLGPVDQRVQDLVVAGGRHLELVPYRLLLGTAVLPPVPLEREDCPVTLGESGNGRRRSFGWAGRAGVGAVHLLVTPVRSVIVRPGSTLRLNNSDVIHRSGDTKRVVERTARRGQLWQDRGGELNSFQHGA